MTDAAPTGSVAPPRFSVERYFALVDEGVLTEDDRVELLEGVVVAMAPANARHDAAVTRVQDTLRGVLGPEPVIRVQCTLVLSAYWAPESDVAVVPGERSAYDTHHPTTALLIVEVGDSSLPQDRITKARAYAAAGIPEYWIVNLRDDRVEVHREPDAGTGIYRERTVARAGERLDIAAFPGAAVAVDDLLPRR